MLTITMKEAKKEMKNIKNYLKGKRNIGKQEQEYLIKKGFKLEDLGTGESAKTYSKSVEIMNIKSKYYLNGTFLVVGIANTKHGKGRIYRGFVKNIKGECEN